MGEDQHPLECVQGCACMHEGGACVHEGVCVRACLTPLSQIEYQGREGWAPGSYLEKVHEYAPDEK